MRPPKFELEPQHQTLEIQDFVTRLQDSPREFERIAAAAFDPSNINGVTNAAAEARDLQRDARQSQEIAALAGTMDPYYRFIQFSCVNPRLSGGTPQIQEVTAGNGDAVQVSAPFEDGPVTLTWPGGREAIQDYDLAFVRAEEISLSTADGPRGTPRASKPYSPGWVEVSIFLFVMLLIVSAMLVA